MNGRKFSEILKRATLYHRRRRTSECIFNKVAGIDFRTGTLLKKSFHQKDFLEIHHNFQCFFRKIQCELVFSKTLGYALQGCNFTETLAHHGRFS